MKCPACAHDNPSGMKFCGECGGRLEAVCAGCQARNPPGNKFCGECGAPLAGAAPAAARPAPAPAPAAPRYASPRAYTPKHLADKILSTRSAVEGERKQVTVMFTDVSGFTAMSERLDPEEVHAIMDRAFEVILAAVHHYEGTINQFLGDGVMALFGAPIAHEDHAHRALAAALAIQENLGPLRDEVRRAHGVDFRLRIGLNTGLVVVGAIGRDLRMDYTAVGDTTNLAARMLNVAKPGQIVLTAQTFRLTAGFFDFEDLGEFTVKGKSEPVRGWAVLRERRGRTRLEVSRERGLTPLAGRDAELTALGEAYAHAVEGHGAVLLVTGDPGVGKSRLLFEFLHRLGAGHREMDATCVSYGRAIPYHPILDLVRRDVGLAEGAADDEVRGAVRERLRALGLDDGGEAEALLAFLGASAPEELLTRLGAQLKERTSALLTDLFLRGSAERPLVLVVENVHWSDPSSEEFLLRLAQAVRGHPVLLLLSARPDFSDTWRQPPVELLAVGGLGAAQARAMIGALLGCERVAEPLLEVLLGKSEGNPLYVEEILRQLQETGGVAVVDGEARLSRPDVTVPETIHDIIAARIDRLEEPLKQTLQGAAVVGRQFATPLLSRLFDGDEPGIAGRLRDLQSLDFVFLLAHVLYSFKHALTQEVVYAGLLERRRRLYHAVVGLGLEELYDGRLEEVAELLAHHFGRSAEHDKAVDYAILAGEKAQRRWATAEALAHFEAALTRLDTMEDSEANRRRRIDAVLKQAEVKFALGRHAEELHALEALEAIVAAEDDEPVARGIVHGRVQGPPGRLGPAHGELRPCRRAPETIGVRQDPHRVAVDPRHAAAAVHDHPVVRGVVHGRVGTDGEGRRPVRSEQRPRRRPAEAVGVREDPDLVVVGAAAGGAAAEDDQAIRRGVVDGAVLVARARRPPRRNELRPGGRPAGAVGVRQPPDVVERAAAEADAGIAAEDDEPVVRLVVRRPEHPARGGRRAARGELGPCRRSAVAVGIGQHPDVVEHRGRAPPVAATEEDHPVAGVVAHGGVVGAGDRGGRPRRQLGPAGRSGRRQERHERHGEQQHGGRP